MHGTGPGQVRQLHGPHAELDVSFDIITGTMILKQKVRDPKNWPWTQHKASVYFNQTNSIFVNLKGLEDNSLLFTFKILSSAGASQTQIGYRNGNTPDIPAQKLRTRHQDRGFIPGEMNEVPLFTNLLDCPWREKYMRLLLPANRIKAWKTVALILLTFRKINPTIWHRITSSESLPRIAGLNWAQVEKKAKVVSKNVNSVERSEHIVSQKEKANAKAKRLMIDQETSQFRMEKGFGSYGFTRLSDMLSPRNGLGQGDPGINGVLE